MRLNESQKVMVEENEKLVYWYAHMKGLNLEEYYDLLAIELCITVIKYNPEKGSLSNYFKLRADNLVKKQYAKTKLQKNANNGVYPIKYAYHGKSDDNVEEHAELQEMFDGVNGEMLRLKADGYTQEEIAQKLGVTQSYISKILRKERLNYE